MTIDTNSAARWAELEPASLAHVLTDLQVDPARALMPKGHLEPRAHAAALFAVEAGVRVGPEAARTAAARAEEALEERAPLLLFLYGRREDRELAALRNALWPSFHVVALYLCGARETRRRTIGGEEQVPAAPDKPSRAHTGVLVVARRAREAMAPETTVEKFDANAAGWNGRPGTPGYGHFRWMRRFVADCAKVPRGGRVLDFGSGAGWVGIEAAERFGARELCAFDPSPQMVALVLENAAARGLANVRATTGFGEDPPYPADGEEPFDLVLSSGVISFSPEVERWLDGLARTVKPGGQLVIGDIHRGSRGFRRRRETHPLLPVRELNARTRREVRVQLEARGFVHEAACGYQLTRPIPELMHLSETRLHGALSPPLLWTNRLVAGLDRALGGRLDDQFDSWVMRLRKQ